MKKIKLFFTYEEDEDGYWPQYIVELRLPDDIDAAAEFNAVKHSVEREESNYPCPGHYFGRETVYCQYESITRKEHCIARTNQKV